MRRYSYRSEGHFYFLRPEYVKTGTGRIKLLGAEMYNWENQYVGYWDHFNMPLTLVLDLENWVRTHIVGHPNELGDGKEFRWRS